MAILSLLTLETLLLAWLSLALVGAAPLTNEANVEKRASKDTATVDFHPTQYHDISVHDEDAAVQVLSNMRAKGQVPKSIFINSTLTMISDIVYDDETTPEAFSIGGIIRHFWPKAGKVIPGINWTERQVNTQGTYFAGWAPASCVFYNDKSPSDVRHDFTTTITKTKTYTAGFDINFGAAAALKLGAEITKTNTYTRLDSYTIKAGSDCQLWVRPFRLWQNQQVRTCKKSGFSSPKTCTGWSAIIHGDFLVQNKTIPNLQCGAGNIRYNDCGAL